MIFAVLLRLISHTWILFVGSIIDVLRFKLCCRTFESKKIASESLYGNLMYWTLAVGKKYPNMFHETALNNSHYLYVLLILQACNNEQSCVYQGCNSTYSPSLSYHLNTKYWWISCRRYAAGHSLKASGNCALTIHCQDSENEVQDDFRGRKLSSWSFNWLSKRLLKAALCISPILAVPLAAQLPWQHSGRQ